MEYRLNPFLGHGKPVTGERFIGRKRALGEIKNKIIAGNLSLVGLPGVGKSSLVANAILTCCDELYAEHRIIVAELSCLNCEDARDFFISFVSNIYEELCQRNCPDNYEQIIRDINDSNSQIEQKKHIHDFFKYLKKDGISCVYILDDFDSVRHYLTRSHLMVLRGLAHDPKFALNVLAVSHRTIYDIELLIAKNGEEPYFFNLFDVFYLGLFDRDDMHEYWKRLQNIIVLDDNGIKNIQKITGYHPHLLDVFNSWLFNEYAINKNILNSINIEVPYFERFDFYKEILRKLESQGLGNPLLQIVIGPPYNVQKSDVIKLEKYGLITTLDGKYVGFCEDFQTFLEWKHRETPVWDIWSATEKKLRELVGIWLKETYERKGDDWVDVFRKDVNHQDYIESLEQAREKERKAFQEFASDNLLDFTYPADLFQQFMTTGWTHWFSQVFGPDKEKWKHKFDVLGKAREPLASNRENVLNDYDMRAIKAYCDEISQCIDMWENNRINP